MCATLSMRSTFRTMQGTAVPYTCPEDSCDGPSSGARRARTADLLGAIQALSQLSYSPSAAQCSASVQRRYQPRERLRIPPVHEVGMRAVAARGLEQAALLGLRVEEDQHESRHGDRVRTGAAAADRVRHVALVVGTVEVAAVPTARERSAEMQR